MTAVQARSRRRQAVIFAVAGVLTLALLTHTRWTHPASSTNASSTTAAGDTSPASPATSASSDPTAAPSSSPTPSSAAPSSPKPVPSTTPPRVSQAQVRAAAVTRLDSITKGMDAGSYSIAAVNLATGAGYSAGSTSGMWTASLYKLFVLEILLHQQGGPLSGSEDSEAVSMIENSDNVAGYDEFDNAGGRSGLQDGFEDLGLTHTVPGVADPAFTTTSATDCITALRHLVQNGPLSPASRAYALNLMDNVEADQRWGVGVDADTGTDFANKNGWLSIDNDNGPGEDDDGLWAVTSAGVIRIHGQQVLMAVLTRHQPDFQTGVNLVETLARAMKPLVSA